jgi:hypothetical protein
MQRLGEERGLRARTDSRYGIGIVHHQRHTYPYITCCTSLGQRWATGVRLWAKTIYGGDSGGIYGGNYGGNNCRNTRDYERDEGRQFKQSYAEYDGNGSRRNDRGGSRGRNTNNGERGRNNDRSQGRDRNDSFDKA